MLKKKESLYNCISFYVVMCSNFVFIFNWYMYMYFLFIKNWYIKDINFDVYWRSLFVLIIKNIKILWNYLLFKL